MSAVIPLGVVGLLLAAAGVVWYKLKADSANLGAQSAQLAEDAAKRTQLETQAATARQTERENLQHEAGTILANPDAGTRTQLALDLLARVRGVH